MVIFKPRIIPLQTIVEEVKNMKNKKIKHTHVIKGWVAQGNPYDLWRFRNLVSELKAIQSRCESSFAEDEDYDDTQDERTGG